MKKSITFFLAVLCVISCSGVTIHLAGDSTVANYAPKLAPRMGWGQTLDRFTNADIKINNRAIGGYSCKSFVDKGKWAELMAQVEEGDFVFIQFGHNDQKKNRPEVYSDVKDAYPSYLKSFVDDVRQKGATPILVTSVCRRFFSSDGKIKKSLGSYPAAMKKLAAKNKVDIIDLNAISEKHFNNYGEEETKKIFLHLPEKVSENYPKGVTDNTHFQEFGAELIASWIVADAKRQSLTVATCFK